MKPGRFMWAMIAVGVLLALAFNNGGLGVGPAAAASPEGEVVLQATPVPTEESGGSGDTGEGAPDLSMSGLRKLQSYRSEMYVEWKGTKDNEPVEGHISIQFAVVREPRASEMNMQSSGLDPSNTAQVSTLRYVQVGDQMWFYDGESDSWMQMPAGDMDTEEGYMGFSPSEMLPGFNKDKLQRAPSTEIVNDVECYKYTFTEKDLEADNNDLGEVTSATGEAWEAVDGDYIVKFRLTVDIASMPDDDMFDKGTVTMSYDILDVNQPIVIEPPADADTNTGERDDIPMLPDAKIEFSLPGMIAYSTQSSVEDATKFYQADMPKNGWKATEGGETLMEDFALLAYTKGGDKANIMISKDESKAGTSIMITIESESSTLGKDLELAETPDSGSTAGDEGNADTGGDAAAVQPPDDVPMMPGVKLSSDSTEGYFVFTTSASLPEIEAFYEKEMPANGWEPEKDNDLVGNGYLDYYKDGGSRVVNVYASEDNGTVTVDIFVVSVD
jgi:hypothetical protein